MRPPTTDDVPAYADAVRRSMRRLADFAVPDPTNLPAVVAAQSPTYRTFMVWARDPEGDHGLVGRVNVANVVRGSFRNATVGYDSYDPYAGRGLFAEGLALVVGLLFADEPRGMGLHRIEANIQPVNTRSAGLARSLGFVHEGFSRDFLHLPGPDGRRDWRDHDRYTLLSTDWPAAPHRPQPPRRVVCVVRVDGDSHLPDAEALGRAVAAELGRPLLSAGRLGSTEAAFAVLDDAPAGAVLVVTATEDDVRARLRDAGLAADDVPVVVADRAPTAREVTRVALAARAASAR